MTEPHHRTMTLRTWQRSWLEQYLAHRRRDFLLVATPGAGKTSAALTAAAHLLADRTVTQVAVVAPTEHLKTQWAHAAAGFGIHLDPTFRNAAARPAAGFHGLATTYAAVGSAPEVHQAWTQSAGTFVILDEAHHAGDSLTWGEGLRTAYTGATARLLLSGTPFRSDTNPIAFASYAPDPDGAQRSVADYTYGYAHALTDGVVRPVVFAAYSGQARWRTSAGAELEARLGAPATPDVISRAWRTALNPDGEWMREVLTAADERLRALRAGPVPDAGGLIIATDRTHARAIAARLSIITGQAPTVVTGDDPASSAKIAEFAASDRRWLVAVKLVSEGVDVPRLAVGVYATTAATPLFFAQAVGRFVPARRPGEVATVFIPSVPPLLTLAADLETSRDHVLGGQQPADGELDDHLIAAANRADSSATAEQDTFTALDADAELDRLIVGGAEYGPPTAGATQHPLWELELPGMPAPVAVAGGGGVPLVPAPVVPVQAGARPVLLHEQIAEVRRELHKAVARYAQLTDTRHQVVHAHLRAACGGPPVSQASLEQLQRRLKVLRTWG